MSTPTYSRRDAANRAARAALGPEAIAGVDFNVTGAGRAWTWASIPQVAPAPKGWDVAEPGPEQGVAAKPAAKSATDALDPVATASPRDDKVEAMAILRRGKGDKALKVGVVAHQAMLNGASPAQALRKAAAATGRAQPPKAAPAPKPLRAASAPAQGKRAAVLAAAQRGTLPAAPDFSAATHTRYRGKLATLIALAEAGDLAGLKAAEIPTYDSSVKALARYRDLCVVALEARAGA